MKILIFSSMAIVGLLLVGLQNQQIRELRAQNVTLQQASAEASQLKADLDKSTGDEAQDEAEIARLREENHDLLKLRNEVNQLRDAKVQFEKVSAENQRLQSLAKNAAAKTESKESMLPVVVRTADLVNRGQKTPEDTILTFCWASRERNTDVLSRCATSVAWGQFENHLNGRNLPDSGELVSIEIVARRKMNATAVQIGLQLHRANNPGSVDNWIVVLAFQNNEWRIIGSGY